MWRKSSPGVKPREEEAPAGPAGGGSARRHHHPGNRGFPGIARGPAPQAAGDALNIRDYVYSMNTYITHKI
jgi:hypothetical protein